MADTQGKKLAYSVTLWDNTNFRYQTFYPGDTLPEWAEGQVRNPKAFVAEGAEAHPRALVPGRDIPIAGPSQLAHDADARFADQPRYVHAGDAIEKGHDIADEQVTVIYAGPPLLHDHVAAKAGDQGAEFTTAGKEQTYKVRTGQVEAESTREAREAQARDLSDAQRADAIFQQQQQAMFDAQQDDMRQQQASALAMQAHFNTTLEAVNKENFQAGQEEQRNAESQKGSGAGYSQSSGLQGVPQSQSPQVNLVGEIGVDPEGTDTKATDAGPAAESLKAMGDAGAADEPKADKPKSKAKAEKSE